MPVSFLFPRPDLQLASLSFPGSLSYSVCSHSSHFSVRGAALREPWPWVRETLGAAPPVSVSPPGVWWPEAGTEAAPPFASTLTDADKGRGLAGWPLMGHPIANGFTGTGVHALCFGSPVGPLHVGSYDTKS